MSRPAPRDDEGRGDTRARAVAWMVVPVAVAVVLLAGAWLVVTRLAPADRTGQIIAGVAWFVVASAVINRLARRRAEVRVPARAGVWVTAIAAAGAFWWTSVRETVVNERVAMAGSAPTRMRGGDAAAGAGVGEPASPAEVRNVLVAEGRLHGLDGHDAEGAARAIRLPGGERVLTLTGFAIDPAPDVRVYLTPDESTTGGDVIDLGGLKGTRGDQQYAIPGDVRLRRHGTLLLWCRAFSVRIAAAPLGRA